MSVLPPRSISKPPAPVDAAMLPAPVRFGAGIAELLGVLHRPKGKPQAAIVLHGAAGVPQRFYQAFAAWLAESRGYACLTYDYRDFGASAQGHVRDARATMADWGLSDQPAAQGFLEATFPGTPVWAIGHSLGGYMLSLQPDAARLARIIVVASGPVHVSDHPWPYRGLAHLFWHGHIPLAVRTLGYLPARLTGFGVDLPAGVYWQWRRWFTSRTFFLGDVGRLLPVPNWRAITAPAHFVAVADDPIVPSAAVWRGMSLYPDAMKSQRTLRPVADGKIGHIGAFAAQNAALWPEILPRGA